MLFQLKNFLFFFIVFFGAHVYAQKTPFATGRQHKGHFFFYWGYNRSGFSKSDLHFKGPEYDFVLKDVKATDRPTKFTLKNYFGIKNISIPQYNYRLGFWVKNNLAVSLGMDHIKYVMVRDQTVGISGHINPRGNYKKHSKFSDGDQIKLTDDILVFEHTDGLNYISAEVDYLPKTFMIVPEKIEVAPVLNGGLGVYVPRTDVRLFGEGINNKFHLAGWGASLMVGIHIEFWRILFFRAGFKVGYANLPDVLTTGESYDRANHQFIFYEGFGAFGANFILFKTKHQKEKEQL